MSQRKDQKGMTDGIIKRGNSYRAVFYKGRDVNGKKEWGSISGASFNDVRKRLLAAKHAVQTRTFCDPKGTTVGQLVDRYLIDAHSRLSPRTFEGYQGIARVGIKPALGSVLLKDLKPERISQYYTDRLAAGRSSTTVRHEAALLHGVLKQAVEWEIIMRNPADRVRPPPRCGQSKCTRSTRGKSGHYLTRPRIPPRIPRTIPSFT